MAVSSSPYTEVPHAGDDSYGYETAARLVIPLPSDAALARPRAHGGLAETVPPPAPAIQLRAGAAGNPLFIVYGAETTPAVLAVIAAAMRCGRPVWGVCVQAADPSTAGLDGMRESARRCLAAIREVQPRGPYALCGYGACGTVAFEVACDLERSGQGPEVVCLVNASLPPALGWASALAPLQFHIRRSKQHAVPATPPYRPRSYSATRVVLVRSEKPAAGQGNPAPAWRRAAQRGLDVICIPGSPADLASQHGALIGLHLDALLTPAPGEAEPLRGPALRR